MDKSRLQRNKLRGKKQTTYTGSKGPGSLEVLLLLFLLLGIMITLNSQTDVLKKFPQAEQETLFTPELMVSDLHYMFETMSEVHPNLNTYITEQEIQLLKDKAEVGFTSEEPRTEFYKAVAPVVARLGDKNTGILIPQEERAAYIAQDAPLFPLDIDFSGEETVVLHNYTNDTLLAPGTPILSINGVPVQQIESTLLDYISGRDPEEKKELLEISFRELQWYVFRMESPYEINVRITIPRPRYRTPLQRVVSRNVIGLTGAQLAEKARPEKTQAPYELTFREEDNTAILTCKSLSDIEGLKSKLAEIKTGLNTEEAKGLVVDLRGTRGYDLDGAKLLGEFIGAGNIVNREEIRVSTRIRRKYARMLPWYQRWYPPIFCETCKILWNTKKGELAVFRGVEDTTSTKQVFDGLISVVVDHGSGELASMIAAAANETGKATTVGETTGSNPFIMSEPMSFGLPETYLWVTSSSKKVIGFGNDMMNVPPVVEVQQNPRDTRRGIDTVLEMAVEIVTARDS